VPGYPFQRERYWLKAPKRRRQAAGNPLLGVRHESARGEITFETEVFPSEPAWLNDHRVFERLIAPGALSGAMAMAASLAEGGGPVALEDMQLHNVAQGGELFELQLWDPAVNAELDKGNLPVILKDEMIMHGALLSDDVNVTVQDSGREWQLTDQALGRNYVIKADGPKSQLVIHSEISGLRGIFASEDWIGNMERLKKEPERFLRPGCYIATLNASPFIEDGLEKTTKNIYSSIVYGILNGE